MDQGIDILTRKQLLDARHALNVFGAPIAGRYAKVGVDLAEYHGAMFVGFQILLEPSYKGKLITFHCGAIEYTILHREVVRVQGGYCPKCGKPVEHRCGVIQQVRKTESYNGLIDCAVTEFDTFIKDGQHIYSTARIAEPEMKDELERQALQSLRNAIGEQECTVPQPTTRNQGCTQTIINL